MSFYTQLWFKKGIEYLEINQFDTAIRCFNEALRYTPNHASSRKAIFIANKAKVQELIVQRDYLLALKYCEDALLVYPTDEECIAQQQLLLIKLEASIKSEEVYFDTELLNIKNCIQRLDSLKFANLAVESQVTKTIQEVDKKLKNFHRLFFTKIKNINTNFILLSEISALNRDVYFEDPSFIVTNNNIRNPLPLGWILFDSYHSAITDYVGALYVKNIDASDGSTIIVWVHKGTNLKSIPDLLADIEIFSQIFLIAILAKLVSVSDCSVQFGSKLEKRIGLEKLKNTTFLVSGHSLGAAIAQLAAGGLPVITFENPGSRQLIINYLRKLGFAMDLIAKQLIIISQAHFIYLAHPNIINTCNDQVGQVFKLNLPYHYSTLKNFFNIIPSHWFFNLNYLCYTLDQHSIQNIANYLQTKGLVTSTSYPVGLNKGYAAYLNPARKDYWKGYTYEIWIRYPQLQKKYENNFEDYLEDFIKMLTETWKKVNQSSGLSQTLQNSYSQNIYVSIQGLESIGIFKRSIINNYGDDKALELSIDQKYISNHVLPSSINHNENEVFYNANNRF